MKINGYKFGHPVFGDPDYYDFGPLCSIEERIQDGYLHIFSDEVNFGANYKLKEMLQNNEAKLIAEVFCTHTMFRKVFEQELNFNFRIPLNLLKNKLEAIFLIVANQDLPRYTNPAVKAESRNLEFYVEKGEILAYLGEYRFELDLAGTSLDSIIKIRPADSKLENEVTYHYIEDSIIIELPQKNFDALKIYAENPNYQKLLISSLLQTALIHGCYRLCGKEMEDFLEKSWARVLSIHWKKMDGEGDFPTINEVAAFVENLLKQPTDLLLKTLAEMDSRNVNPDME